MIDTIGLQGNLVAAVIAKPERAAMIFASVPVDFFDFPHRYVAEAIHRLRLRQTPITLTAIEDQMRRTGHLDTYGGTANLMALTMACPTDEDTVAYSLGVVARQVQIRELRQRATSIIQTIDEQPDTDPLEIARLMGETRDLVTSRIESIDGDIFVPTLREFLLMADDAEAYDWVIPGLLEHGDRLMLTGAEGLGKSTVLRQLAVCAAAGVHPFDHYQIPQKRVLLVDCENNPVPTRRALRPLRIAAAGMGFDPGDWMHIESRPGGMRLDRPEEETSLLNIVQSVVPDLLIIGPLYRLFSRDGNEEDTGRAVSRVLDRCRALTNCAVVTEAHTPHQSAGQARTLRPVGTSLWLRWPEFGYGIAATKDHTPEHRSVKMVPWRGDRSERDWPKRLVGGGYLPWRHDADYGVSPDESTIDVPVPYKD